MAVLAPGAALADPHLDLNADPAAFTVRVPVVATKAEAILVVVPFHEGSRADSARLEIIPR